MGRDVARLVVGVEDEVHPGDVVVRLGEAHLVGEVAAEVEVRVDGDVDVRLVLHAVDVGGEDRQLGQQVEHVLVHRLPVLGLLHPLVVALDEHRLALHGQDAGREHGHGVGVGRHRAQDVDHVLRQGAPLLELLDHLEGLRHGRHLAGHEEPEEALDVGVVPARDLGQALHGLGDVLAAEADALLRVEVGDVGDQALDVARAADDLLDGDLLHLGAAELLDQTRGPRPMLLDLPLQGFLQAHRRSSSIRLPSAGRRADWRSLNRAAFSVRDQ